MINFIFDMLLGIDREKEKKEKSDGLSRIEPFPGCSLTLKYYNMDGLPVFKKNKNTRAMTDAECDIFIRAVKNVEESMQGIPICKETTEKFVERVEQMCAKMSAGKDLQQMSDAQLEKINKEIHDVPIGYYDPFYHRYRY